MYRCTLVRENFCSRVHVDARFFNVMTLTSHFICVTLVCSAVASKIRVMWANVLTLMLNPHEFVSLGRLLLLALQAKKKRLVLI